MENNSRYGNKINPRNGGDLLACYHQACDYFPQEIKQWKRGLRYSTVMLGNGNIGVCANQNCGQLSSSPPSRDKLDLTVLSDRVWFQAYINAVLNYDYNYQLRSDITQCVNFAKYNSVVMIGLFKPILKKLIKNQIKVKVFDLKFQKTKHNYHQLLKSDLKKTSAVILTATSITNRTFNEILNQSSQTADIFILGPSTILNLRMFELEQIKGLFGMIFKPNDHKVLNVIGQGEGTRGFVKHAEKVGWLNIT